MRATWRRSSVSCWAACAGACWCWAAEAVWVGGCAGQQGLCAAWGIIHYFSPERSPGHPTAAAAAAAAAGAGAAGAAPSAAKSNCSSSAPVTSGCAPGPGTGWLPRAPPSMLHPAPTPSTTPLAALALQAGRERQDHQQRAAGQCGGGGWVHGAELHPLRGRAREGQGHCQGLPGARATAGWGAAGGGGGGGGGGWADGVGCSAVQCGVVQPSDYPSNLEVRMREKVCLLPGPSMVRHTTSGA